MWRVVGLIQPPNTATQQYNTPTTTQPPTLHPQPSNTNRVTTTPRPQSMLELRRCPQRPNPASPFSIGVTCCASSGATPPSQGLHFFFAQIVHSASGGLFRQLLPGGLGIIGTPECSGSGVKRGKAFVCPRYSLDSALRECAASAFRRRHHANCLGNQWLAPPTRGSSEDQGKKVERRRPRSRTGAKRAAAGAPASSRRGPKLDPGLPRRGGEDQTPQRHSPGDHDHLHRCVQLVGGRASWAEFTA